MSQLILTVIIPCFNEEMAIQSTILKLREDLKTISHYELVVVDDGSTDKTLDILSKLAESEQMFYVLTHERNLGYGAALKTGIKHSKTEWIAITDADGTYPNEEIKKLLKIATDDVNTDMVVGARTKKDVTYPLIRKIPKWFLRRYVSWIANRDIPDMNSGLRVFRRSIAERFLNILPDGFSFTTTITLAMLTNHYVVHYVPISYYSRIGRSKIRPIRDTLQFIQLIVRTGIYFAPLRVFMPIAGLLLVAFLITLFYDIYFLSNITDKTLMLLMLNLNTVMFALLADMIDKRN